MDFAFLRMDAQFTGRKSKDQPATAGIHIWQAKDITQESASLVCVFSVKQSVHTVDHGGPEIMSAQSQHRWLGH
jgi:hypothetical protein